MTSVRSVLECIWPDDGQGTKLPDNPSLARHLFGFARRRVPTDPVDGTPTVSVRQQVEALQGEHIHLNVIRVGFDAIATAEDRAAAGERLDYAVYRTRIVYKQVPLGVGRVRHWAITAAAADGLDDIGSEAEARELWESTFVDNDGMDVFVTRTISAPNFIGLAPAIGGDCDKPSTNDAMLGGRIDRDDDGVARTFAHEIGHFLGLPHNHGANCPASDADRQRLMAQTRCWPNLRESLILVGQEGTTMRGHCSVREGC